jgi:DNA-binding NarL/FixJ family response regulator
MRRLKVLAVDDHRLMLDAIRAVLDREDDILLVAEADAGDKVVPLVGQTGPDVVLLDVRMPGMDGLAVLEQLRERYPSVAVVMLSAIRRWFAAPSSGGPLRSCSSTSTRATSRRRCARSSWVRSSVRSTSSPRPAAAPPTTRA